LITSFTQKKLVAANDIILHFIADCNNPEKTNFKAIFAPAERYTNAGIGIAITGDQTIVTLVLTKNFSSKPVSNAVLTAAKLQGSVDYSGNGESMSKTSKKGKDAFKHTGKQGLTQLNPANLAVNDAFPSTVDDKSAKCPTWIAPENAKKDGYFRDWALTKETCTRGKDGYNPTNNLLRIPPFAHKGKCFHRLAFCSAKGQVWVKDREYNTLNTMNSNVADMKKEAILKNFASDKSTECPGFINGPLLRKRFVQDWYLTAEKCTRASGKFDKHGFNRENAIPMDHKCFHRALFCDNKGKVWARDSEYKTLAEWRAEQH
jgi:hypothetical protein